ncbi:hypothetical protein FA95DRAFT_741049 [Auriscalpium vulgare]|uniref:Uncharacterized protein n=1 Tax=Auriscalpium vulgare TaxID=40419 RepID=A0ACB8SBZ1_9AGAM|nr:hypothetical protein FA95DRAFT_741049 [Auriscalpium vulgare]
MRQWGEDRASGKRPSVERRRRRRAPERVACCPGTRPAPVASSVAAGQDPVVRVSRQALPSAQCPAPVARYLRPRARPPSLAVSIPAHVKHRPPPMLPRSRLGCSRATRRPCLPLPPSHQIIPRHRSALCSCPVAPALKRMLDDA